MKYWLIYILLNSFQTFSQEKYPIIVVSIDQFDSTDLIHTNLEVQKVVFCESDLEYPYILFEYGRKFGHEGVFGGYTPLLKRELFLEWMIEFYSIIDSTSHISNKSNLKFQIKTFHNDKKSVSRYNLSLNDYYLLTEFLKEKSKVDPENSDYFMEMLELLFGQFKLE